MRTVIFGVDGLSFRLLQPLIARGDLPNFARLQREGVEAELISTVPPMTPPAWMSLVTGMKPAKHGVYDFWEFDTSTPQLKSRVVTSRKGGKAIWNTLSEYGKRVIVMNVPVTYPPEPVNGIMVSGLMTPSPSAPFTFPNSFKEELYRVVPDYRIDLSLEKTSPHYFVDAVLQMTERRIELQEHLLSTHEWDFAFLCYVGPDRIQHRIWDELIDLTQHSTRYYRLLDDALGRVMNRLKPGDALFVVSDHGFAGASQWFYINEYLCRRHLLDLGSPGKRNRARLMGIGREFMQKMHLLEIVRQARETYQHVYRKPPVEKRKGVYRPFFEDLSWENSQACALSTMAFSGGCADIFLAPYSTLSDVEELRQMLAAERHPETGAVLAEAVYAKDVYGIGPFCPPEEHIILIPKPGTTFHLSVGRKHVWEPFGEAKGVHEREGVFYAWGGGIRQGAHIEPLQIYDVVPTVLHMLGISADEAIDGSVAHEIFDGLPDVSQASVNENLVARKLEQLRIG